MLPLKDLAHSDQAKKHYIKAANKGIIKVASKMGGSTVQKLSRGTNWAAARSRTQAWKSGLAGSTTW